MASLSLLAGRTVVQTLLPVYRKQKGQVSLNHSPAFYLKLTYWYPLTMSLVTEKNDHIVAEKSLTEKCPYVLYKSDRRKNEKLKKEGKMRISILIFITQYSLPT